MSQISYVNQIIALDYVLEKHGKWVEWELVKEIKSYRFGITKLKRLFFYFLTEQYLIPLQPGILATICEIFSNSANAYKKSPYLTGFLDLGIKSNKN